ncbi:catalase/peroxidase HPI [Leeuwenhoekiella nanhaiensis]|uniref:Catalase-peroxidase n=1 Tax=Leeuwenhoekiella nanhaiensis TaxID=1655491 RepID=A0A2G1VQT3_9FLAO|nr:catalase/peroxidase HPI [Leeuwenhoekiella nanhaiensis]PHQ29132.1 catalase/peroxidase HPI [Leeuwenhoekiella nanhaiensis]
MKDIENPQGLSECPFRGTRIGGALGTAPQNEDWWPQRLPVDLLHQEQPVANPLRDENYKEAFSNIDYEQLKKDIKELLVSSQDWWPADYGNYGPQMIRMAWHSAGTYRIADGLGGASQAMQRFAPIGSWWDNGNIDKSRRLIWPIKKKYGAALSWADLIVLTGNCALEIMGFPTFGFGGGRRDAWEPDRGTYWGPEFWDGKYIDEIPKTTDHKGHPGEMVNNNLRWVGGPKDEYHDLENPLAATHSNLIYVNPEGPGGNMDPIDSARNIRESFKRMAMNDEETVALIAGGHAFGKSHGAVPADKIGAAPEAAPMHLQGFGWHNPVGSGNAEFTSTNGIEGSWTPNPTQWDNDYLTNLFKYEWEQKKSPAGAGQWTPVDPDAPKTPDAHLDKQEDLMMMTSDLALKMDPEYRKVCEKFMNDFDYFTDAFAKAWYKLTHRDMGPKDRYLGPEVPKEDMIWQDPVPARDYELVNAVDIAALKQVILNSGLSVSALVNAAWSAASVYRHSDKRGGANGARIALEPQNNWDLNRPAELNQVLDTLKGIQSDFSGKLPGKQISLADLVVLGGCAAVEKAAKDAGFDVEVPFTPGRTDATAEQTDVESFDWLKPVSDGFKNYHNDKVGYKIPAERIFLDRAHLLNLSAPEWTVLTGGLRVLEQNFDHSKHGVFTERPGQLTNDFFQVLTSMDYEWKPQNYEETLFNINDRATGSTKYTATRCDLVFGSNAQLRNLAEVYAADDAQERFVNDFIKAWDKVMMLDRYDVKDE